MYLNFENLIKEPYNSAIACTIESAKENGIKISLIGGIVRDLILKKTIKDIDIIVEADAIEFGKYLENKKNCKIISTQENLRTVKVEFENGIVIDFASSREEYYTNGGLLPKAYNFGCELERDVKRRDFTINTLAIALTGREKYSVIDYYDGYKDIENKKIRILHEKSFIDDPSRIVRAIKFQMRLGFDIEKNTYELMENYLENAPDTIPLERIKSELIQYFSLKNDDLYKNLVEKRVYKLICNKPVMEFDKSAFEEIKSFVNEERLNYIYMMILLTNSDIENVRLNLNSDEKKLLNEIKNLISASPIDINDNEKIYNAFKNKSEFLPSIYYLITKDNAVLKYLANLQQIKVFITGKDLIDLGFKPSPYFSFILKEVLKEKLEGKIKTKEEEIKFVKTFL